MLQKLFVANTSKHNQELHYWVLGAPRAYSETVPVGQQIELCKGKPLTNDDFNHIIQQLERYGAVSVKSLGKHKKYAGVCYQFDKPIDIDAIYEGIQHNDNAIAEESLENRKAVAAAMNHNLNEVSRGHVSEVELTIEEQTKPGSDEPTKIETISAVREGKTPRKARSG